MLTIIIAQGKNHPFNLFNSSHNTFSYRTLCPKNFEKFHLYFNRTLSEGPIVSGTNMVAVIISENTLLKLSVPLDTIQNILVL